MENRTSFGFSATALKLLALVTMTIDHIGYMFFPGVAAWRIVGRLAYPIFAFMIAEGCRYTRSRARYLGSIALLAFVCQLVYFIVDGSLFMCVLVSFSLSVILIFMFEDARKKKTPVWLPVLVLLMIMAACDELPRILAAYGFAIDYGFAGIVLPVLISVSHEKWPRLALTALGLVLVAIPMGGVQWWGLLGIIPLALYNGQRGRYKLKYFFYLYYPLHLAALEGLHLLLN